MKFNFQSAIRRNVNIYRAAVLNWQFCVIEDWKIIHKILDGDVRTLIIKSRDLASSW